MDKIEEQFYETATNEVQQNRPIKSIFGKAYSDAMGDKEKAASLYIKYRVEQLRAEYFAQLKKQKSEKQAKTIRNIGSTIMLIMIWFCISTVVYIVGYAILLFLLSLFFKDNVIAKIIGGFISLVISYVVATLIIVKIKKK